MAPHTANNPSPDPKALPSALPPALLDDLRSLEAAGPVPAAIDDTVLTEARKRLALSPVAGRIDRRRWAWVSVAAAAALAAGLWMIAPSTEPTTTAPLAREDIDRNGRVDILDAFKMARQIEHQSVLDESWDLTGDGLIDQADVDHVAAQAVALNGERG